MCGLVGTYGDLGRLSGEIFDDMLYMDVVRGKDSVGVCLVDIDNTYEVYKSLGGPRDLYNKYEKEASLGRFSLHNKVLAMGHNRAATMGVVNEENAHPFDIGRVVGAHNGTVNLWSLYNLQGYHQHDIDSKILYTELNHSYDPQRLWDEAYGAMTLTWWDKTTETFNIVSNGERPLSYIIHNDVLYYASEEWMLYGALLRNKINKFNNPTSFKVNSWYVIKYDKQRPLGQQITIENKELSPPQYNDYGVFGQTGKGKGGFKNVVSSKRIEFSIEAFSFYGNWENVGWFDGLTQENRYIKIYGVSVKDPKAQEVINELNKGRCNRVFYVSSDATLVNGEFLVDWPRVKEDTSVTWGEATEIDTIKGFAGAFITQPEFETAVKESGGCVNCLGDIVWEERRNVYWVDATHLACSDCADIVEDFHKYSNQAWS